FFDRFPKVPAGGRINTHGSNHNDGVPSFVPGCTLPHPAVVLLVWTVAPGARLGRSAAAVPLLKPLRLRPRLSVPTYPAAMLKGTPARKVMMRLVCQPDATAFTSPRVFFANGTS